MPNEFCPHCGSAADQKHDDECMVGEHEAMVRGDTLAGALHDRDECELCLIQNDVRCQCSCRCGLCCQYMIIEATALDARREPKIRERGSIIDEGGEIPPNQAGWMLNRGRGCIFFSRDSDGSGVCEIYETRPLCCRLFDCDTDERAIQFREQHFQTNEAPDAKPEGDGPSTADRVAAMLGYETIEQAAHAANEAELAAIVKRAERDGDAIVVYHRTSCDRARRIHQEGFRLTCAESEEAINFGFTEEESAVEYATYSGATIKVRIPIAWLAEADFSVNPVWDFLAIQEDVPPEFIASVHYFDRPPREPAIII